MNRRELLKAAIFTFAGLSLIKTDVLNVLENEPLDFWIKNCPKLDKHQCLDAINSIPQTRVKTKAAILDEVISKNNIAQFRQAVSHEFSTEELCWVSGNLFSESELILLIRFLG